jgi:hypothetical protein
MNYLEENGHGLFKAFGWTDQGKPLRFSVRIASVPAGIKTEGLPNTTLGHHLHANPFAFAMLSWSLVTTAWHVLGLRIEETALRLWIAAAAC